MSNPAHLTQSAEPASGQLFDVFFNVFIEGQAAPVFTGTQTGIPLTTEHAFRCFAQRMFPTVRKVTITVLRSKNTALQEIPEWTLNPVHFQLGQKYVARSKGPAADFPKVVEVNGVVHRLPRPARKKAPKKPAKKKCAKKAPKQKAKTNSRQKRVTKSKKRPARVKAKKKALHKRR